MTINIDIQSIEDMRKAFLEAGDAEFTHIEPGIINGHKVEVLPEEQRRVNSDFVKNLTDTLFPNDKSEGMMSTKNLLMNDIGKQVSVDLTSDGPLTGSRIAQVLGDAIEALETSAQLREDVTTYVKEQLVAKNCPEVEDLPSIELGSLFEAAQRAIAKEENPENKETAWKKTIDKMINVFMEGTKNINSNQDLDSTSRTVLKRLAFDNKEFAESEYHEIAKAAYKEIDTSNVKEVLLHPDEFQNEDRVRVLTNFGFQIGNVFSKINQNVELATRDLEMVTQLVLTMMASNDPEFKTYLTTQTADIQELRKVSENISGEVQEKIRPKDGLKETIYANRGLAVFNNLLILSKGYSQAAGEIKQGYRTDIQRVSGLTDAQCAKLDSHRIDKYLSKATDKEDRARLWNIMLEDMKYAFDTLKETKVLCKASKDVMANIILEKPDLYESGALFIAPLSLEAELPTEDLIHAFGSQGNSLDLLQTVANFGKSMNNAFLKLNLQEKIDVDAEGSELSTLMLMHILANRHEKLARIVIDEENYLNRLNTMLDGLYKDSTKTEDAILYTNAKAILTAMLSVKAQVGKALQEKFSGAATS